MNGEKDIAGFVENIHTLAKLYGMKIGEVEDKAGISRGYVSRLKKAGENANIQDDTVKKIADVFGCSAKAILCYDLKNMSKDDLYYFNFLLKLYEDTCNDRIIWDWVDYKLTKELISKEEYENHPYKYFYEWEDYVDDKGERKSGYGWVSDFISEGEEREFVYVGAVLTTKIGKNNELIFVRIEHGGAQTEDGYKELYLKKDGEIMPLCANYKSNGGGLLYYLYMEIALRQQYRPRLTDEIREVIDGFMGKGEEDA